MADFLKDVVLSCIWLTHLFRGQVPGLAENRPSVLKGDCLYVRILDSEGVAGDHEYQGYVHEVLQNEVALGFSDRYV